MEQATAEASPLTLLFVDDEASILSSLKRLFRPHGYKILTAGGGAEGLAVLEKEHVDLVVSDMRMPEMDGAHFLEQVRDRWPQVVRILLTGYADVGSTIAAINRGEIYRYVSKPWDDNEIVLTVRDALERKRLEAENLRLSDLTARQNEELKALNAGLEQKVTERTAALKHANELLQQGFMMTVRTFSSLIELRGGRLAGHGRRVAEHSKALAQSMGLSQADQQDILLAGLLHDIGKISLPDNLLDKPFAALAGEARNRVMEHPVKGQQLVAGVEQLANAAKIIRHHHEHVDGSGYPDGVVGLAIPIGSRIIAVTNDYDALQMGTLTLKEHTPEQALEYILGGRGRQYDPTVVNAFAALVTKNTTEAAPEHALRPGELKPGMMLARDFLHPQGYVMATAGKIIDRQLIDQLETIEREQQLTLSVYVKHVGRPATLRDADAKPAPTRLWKEVALRPAQLKPGMTLSRPLRHHDGYLLLSANYSLDDMVIDQVRQVQALDESKPMTVYIRVEDRS
ncbi:MAG TPA: HD domain-containing phosphohydrolase [Rhodocyclaceae bacterium]|nr:HD domain-containing phosphohydrolase [Rhodocyclaceae bacterium]